MYIKVLFIMIIQLLKGKWQRPLSKKIKIKNYLGQKMNLKEQFLYNIKFCRSKIFNLLPNYIKIKIKKIVIL